MKKIICICLFVIGVCPAAQAQEGTITSEMISKKNSEMEEILNRNEQRLAAIQYLHNHISEDARFRLTVNNPALPIGPDQPFEMNKEMYINTYINGTNLIDNYTFDIETVSLETNADKNEAVTEDVLTERGVMMNPYNLSAPGKPFISRTRCKTRRAIENGQLISKGGACHTEVSFEEEI